MRAEDARAEGMPQVFKARGYEVGQEVRYSDGPLDLTHETYRQDGVFFVKSEWDDDEHSKAWGYKSWFGFWYVAILSNLIVWPASYALKQLPGVRNVM